MVTIPRGALALWVCAALASPNSSPAQRQPSPPVARSMIMRSDLPQNLDTALRAGKVRVLDRAGTLTPSVSASRIALDRGQFIAARVGAKPTLDLRLRTLNTTEPSGTRTVDSVIVLPFRFLGHTQDNATVHLRPVIVRDKPMQYDNGVFRGSILIGLEDSLAPSVHKELDGRIQFRLVSEGYDLTPDSLEVGSTNLPLTRVSLVGREPSDSISVRVIPQFDMGGTVVWLPVRPTLIFEDPPTTASGLGIQTVTFPVRVVGASIKDHITVTLAVNHGSLKDNRVDVDPSGSASVHFRSSGIGPASITATSPGFASSTATVTFVWPFIFVAAALLGGCVGGLAKKFVLDDAKAPSAGKAILVGLLAGFVVAVAYYAVNVNLLPFNTIAGSFDEAAVFAFALLGGLFGVRAPKLDAAVS